MIKNSRNAFLRIPIINRGEREVVRLLIQDMGSSFHVTSRTVALGPLVESVGSTLQPS